MIIVPSIVGVADPRKDTFVTTMTVGDLIANGGELRYYGYGPAVVPPFGALNEAEVPGRGAILQFIESYWDGLLLSSTRMTMLWTSTYTEIDANTIQSVTLNGRTANAIWEGQGALWSFGSGGDSGSRPFRLAEMNTNQQTEFTIVWGDK